ncbi:MAG TPA: hypothetical protein PLW44_05795 [Chitinophagales bacterium]|nr:hypothetical protein [Chitinophagales bacterium]
MKSIYFTIIFLSATLLADAQLTKGLGFSGTNVGVMYSKNIERNTGLPRQAINASVIPEFGVVLSKHFTVSARFGFDFYQYKDQRNIVYGYDRYDSDFKYEEYSFGPGISFRYYKIFKSNFGFFVQMAFDAQAIRSRQVQIVPNVVEQSEKLNGYRLGFNFTPGIVYFPRPLVCIYATYGSFGYSYDTKWVKDSPNIPEKNHNLVFNYLPSSLKLGVDFFFNAKKKKPEQPLTPQ